MTTNPMAEIAANACMDCPADVAVVPSISGITGHPVPVVTVRHAESCPWAARHVYDDVVPIGTALGVILHCRHTADDTPPE